MKKVILGTGLIICGVFGILTRIIVEAIHLASPNRIIQMGVGPYIYISYALLIFGLILNIIAFFWDEDDNRATDDNETTDE